MPESPSLPRPQPPVAPPFRRGLNRVEAAGYIGISPSKFDELVRHGDMPPAKTIGSRRIWDVRQLDVAFDALPGGMQDDEAAADGWDDVAV